MFTRPSDWSSEALGTARAELQKRGLAIPKLPLDDAARVDAWEDLQKPPPAPPSATEMAEQRKDRFKRDGWLLLGVGLLACAIAHYLSGGSWSMAGPFMHGASLGGEFVRGLVGIIGVVCFAAGISDLVRAARVKPSVLIGGAMCIIGGLTMAICMELKVKGLVPPDSKAALVYLVSVAMSLTFVVMGLFLVITTATL